MSSIEFFLDVEYAVILHIGALLIIFVVDEGICLLMKQLIIFKQNLQYTAQHLFFSFLDPHQWPEIHPSVTFLGIDIFFSETCYGIRDLILFCVTNSKFLGKISFEKKRPAIVKKQVFLDENQVIRVQYSLVAKIS